MLNVIDSDTEVARIADRLQAIVWATGGIGYVTVYEGDHSGIGRKTGPDQYQRNEPLREYLRFFLRSEIRNGMIIIR